MRKTASKSTTRTKTIPYDVAEQLRMPVEMAAYLDAWLAEAPEDAAGIARALGDIARAKGMAQVARDAGLSRESLYKALMALIMRDAHRIIRFFGDTNAWAPVTRHWGSRWSLYELIPAHQTPDCVGLGPTLDGRCNARC